MSDPVIPALVDDLFRRTAATLTAAVVRVIGPAGLDLADDVVQDTMMQALRTWPFRGIPDDPAAWLMRTARNRAFDHLRRHRHHREAGPALLHHLEVVTPGGASERDSDALHLLLLCVDPAQPAEATVPLLLQTLGGLSAKEIARVLLMSEATTAQRIVRAKRRFRDAPPTPPTPLDLAARRAVAREVIYLMFTEGHTPAARDEALRHELAREALRLAFLICRSLDAEPADHALAALLCLHAARFSGRADPAGELILLADQDRAAWEPALVRRGMHHLREAADALEPTRWHLEAAIAAEHVTAPSLAETNWRGIVDLYEGLEVLVDSVPVRVNHAVAIAMTGDTATALHQLDALDGSGGTKGYPWFHAVRAWLRDRVGDPLGADADRAAALALDPPPAHRQLLMRQLLRVVD
jgi:RNA polymerase sigma-70 factor (ECF subfamily)